MKLEKLRSEDLWSVVVETCHQCESHAQPWLRHDPQEYRCGIGQKPAWNPRIEEIEMTEIYSGRFISCHLVTTILSYFDMFSISFDTDTFLRSVPCILCRMQVCFRSGEKCMFTSGRCRRSLLQFVADARFGSKDWRFRGLPSTTESP